MSNRNRKQCQDRWRIFWRGREERKGDTRDSCRHWCVRLVGAHTRCAYLLTVCNSACQRYLWLWSRGKVMLKITSGSLTTSVTRFYPLSFEEWIFCFFHLCFLLISVSLGGRGTVEAVDVCVWRINLPCAWLSSPPRALLLPFCPTLFPPHISVSRQLTLVINPSSAYKPTR